MSGNQLTYGSICSGIEAASVAWKELDWQPSWFAEVDPFCCEVLAHHYPDIPNLMDITAKEFLDDATPVDVLIGGTPCQAFSVAGRRRGFDDDRGNLTLRFLDVVGHIRPRWVVWENVPGVLSIDKGRTFGTILAKMAEHGYGWAYRILDAQYFGVPQRRRRIFLVGHSGGEWQRCSEVLAVAQSMSGHPPTRKASQETVAGGTGKSTKTHSHWAVTYDMRGNGNGKTVPPIIGDHANRPTDYTPVVVARPGMQVRRLTPVECERLQGFPDNYTLIDRKGKPAADSPRYRAIGNSFAVPVVRWIGQRIDRMSA